MKSRLTDWILSTDLETTAGFQLMIQFHFPTFSFEREHGCRIRNVMKCNNVSHSLIILFAVCGIVKGNCIRKIGTITNTIVLKENITLNR